jgi:hypothetical protein
LEADAFAADWRHCDQVANYLAQLVAHDRPDSFLYANLLSTVLNELLESVFARHRRPGSVRCTLLREGRNDRVELVVPVDASARAFYEETVAAAQSAGVAETYTRTLLGKEAPADLLGLLELAADYGARLSVEETGSAEEIRLVLQVTLADGGTPAIAL